MGGRPARVLTVYDSNNEQVAYDPSRAWRRVRMSNARKSNRQG